MRLPPIPLPTLLLCLASLASLTTGAHAEKGIEPKPLTLGECIQTGLGQNPAAEISRQSLKAVQSREGEARGGYYPTFKLSSSYTYATPPEGNRAASPDSYDDRLSLRQTLYDA